MMARTLAAVAAAVNGRLDGADRPFDAVGIDTRSLERGALFVALRGERHDGNEYVADAAARGAAGALVSKLAAVELPQVRVDDTRAALGAMARAWRASFSYPVVAITGSSGKTTVKELTASILAVRRRVCVTQGNLNNDIGVPLTLMRFAAEHDAAVVELGANHAGEINYLARLAQPTIGLITNAGAAHLEGFGSIAGVAAAKGELLDHLPANGAAVLNADDVYIADWRKRSTASRVLTFGVRQRADFTLADEPELAPSGARFTMATPAGRIAVELPLPGAQNVANALAAAAAAYAAGASADEIATGLARVATVRGRMNVLAGLAGAVIVDDSYNANPSSVRAALDYLATLRGRRIFVLGDMYELGADAPRLHAEIGEYAKGRCDKLIAIGPLSRHAAVAFEGGAAASGAAAPSSAERAAAPSSAERAAAPSSAEGAAAFDDVAPAIDALGPMLAADCTVLVKGSRAMGLERVAAALAAAPSAPQTAPPSTPASGGAAAGKSAPAGEASNGGRSSGGGTC